MRGSRPRDNSSRRSASLKSLLTCCLVVPWMRWSATLDSQSRRNSFSSARLVKIRPLSAFRLRYHIAIKGFRSEEITLVTTLIDAELYPAEELASLYQRRWTIEVCQADYDEKDNLYRGGRWAYSSYIGLVEAGPLVPAVQALKFRRKPMRYVREDVVPPRAQRGPISASC